MTSINFPLYELIKKETIAVKDKSLTTEQKSEFMEKVKILDHDSKEYFYVLVKCFELDNRKIGKSFNTDIPFNGKYNSNCVEFNLLEFPTPLQQILYNFLIKYNNKVIEESNEEW